MCLEVKSDYQSLFHETNLGFGGLLTGPRACYLEKFENGASQIG